MRKFTKKEIDDRKELLEKSKYPKVNADLGEGIKFSYYVIDAKVEPGLKNFVMRMTGDSSDGYVFGISSDVPKQFRDYWVAHEFIEFIKIGIDKKGRCATAIEQELRLVPKNIRFEYIALRKDFFKGLIPYVKNYPQYYNEEDISEITQSYKRLEKAYNLLNKPKAKPGLEYIIKLLMIFGGISLIYSLFSKPNRIAPQSMQLAPPFPNYMIYIFLALLLGGIGYFMAKKIKK